MPGSRESTSTLRSTIGCIIPAHDDEAGIAGVLSSLLEQTRVPDVIHVIVDNTSDGTVRMASAFAGPHRIVTDLGEQFTEVFVHDIGENPDEKVGALNYGYALVEGYDYLLCVDGDAIGDPRAVEHLEYDAISDAEFTAVDPQSLLREHAPAAPGGQLSIFSTTALRAVMEADHQRRPWHRGAE